MFVKADFSFYCHFRLVHCLHLVFALTISVETYPIESIMTVDEGDRGMKYSQNAWHTAIHGSGRSLGKVLGQPIHDDHMVLWPENVSAMQFFVLTVPTTSAACRREEKARKPIVVAGRILITTRTAIEKSSAIITRRCLSLSASSQYRRGYLSRYGIRRY